jgi:DNA polymerase
MTVRLDFETRSKVDLKKVGGWKYAKHPSTQTLCLAYAIDDGDVGNWHRDHPRQNIEESPEPTALLDAIENGEIVEAHNAFFEWVIWLHVVAREHPRWPKLRQSQLLCSAAMAGALSLPRDLDRLVKALGLPESMHKDKVGERVMKKLSKPARPIKADPFREWHEKPEDLETLWSYNVQDVVAERAASKNMRNMSKTEFRLWRIDQKINARGLFLDRRVVDGAIKIIEDEHSKLNQELFELTDFQVDGASAVQNLQKWIDSKWPDRLYNLKAETIDEILDTSEIDIPDDVHRALTIRRTVGRTSVKKFYAMRDRMDTEDDRARDLMLFHAAHTGRWGGRGIQPHNFPRGSGIDQEIAAEAIMTGDRDWFELLYDDVTEGLSSSLRGAICAPPGKDLIVADFAAIEARVVCWLAGHETALQIFRNGVDIYKHLAASIYNVPNVEDVTPGQRFFGKQAILGLGFGMGAPKFQATCLKFGEDIDQTFAQEIVDVYRHDEYSEVRDLWSEYEMAAMNAIRNPGAVYEAGRCKWGMKGRWLFCQLPSKRLMGYFRPSIRPRETPWGAMRDCLTYMTLDTQTSQWIRVDTYGGKLTENVTQAVARDCLREAIFVVEAHETYTLVLHVHDELLSEVDEGEGDVKEFETIISKNVEWNKGLPIAAEGWRGKRFKK